MPEAIAKSDEERSKDRPVAAYRLGIDVGGTKILAAIIDAQGRVVGRAKRRTKPKLGYQGVLHRLRLVADEAMAEAGVSLGDDILSLGVGLPGPVLPREGVIQGAVNLGWGKSPVAQDLSKLFANLPVTVGNDVNLGAFGEVSHGAALGAESCFALFMGTGLGAALVLDGAVVAGAHGFAGELGHLPGPFDHALCTCGQRGCLETIASKRGLQRLIREQVSKKKPCFLSSDEIDDLRSSALRKAWLAECPVVCSALERACAALAWGIVAGGLAADPQVIILGGGVMEELGNELLPLVEKELRSYSFYLKAVRPVIRLAQLGDDAVAIGAAVVGAQA